MGNGKKQEGKGRQNRAAQLVKLVKNNMERAKRRGMVTNLRMGERNGEQEGEEQS